MKKKGSAAAAAIAFAMISTSAVAMDGQFFVNASVGQSNFNSRYFNYVNGDAHSSVPFGLPQVDSTTDTAGALRLGYLWHGSVDFGVEAGYADLGEMTGQGVAHFVSEQTAHVAPFPYTVSLASRGWLLGGTAKYNMGSWYLSARGGFFRARLTGKENFTEQQLSSYSHSITETTNRFYAGLGVGYHLSRSWSVGLNYDFFDLGHVGDGYAYVVPFGQVHTYSASVEFLF